MKFTLELYDYWEYLIPIIFLIFTHIVDEKIHRHWENASFHKNKWIRRIHRYQWELFFLVISLCSILGIKIAHLEGEMFYVGSGIILVSILFITMLFIVVMTILDDEAQKMSASILYCALLAYILYVTTGIYFLKLKSFELFRVGGIPIYKPYIYLLALIIFFALYIPLKRYIDKQLYFPVLMENDVANNIRVYKHPETTKVKKGEALSYILRYYKNKNSRNLAKWCKIGEKELPAKFKELKEIYKI